MRRVLAVAAVQPQHKELVLKDLKKIFRKIKITPEQLLTEEIINPSSNVMDSSNVFKAYPYITLTIPNYQAHRRYLQKVYKNSILFSKFILLISEGNDYPQLISNRNQPLLKQKCRNWSDNVQCLFDSSPVFTPIQQQLDKIDQVLGEMDIRGKITQIDAAKKFHLIESHKDDGIDQGLDRDGGRGSSSLLKLFFGLEVVACCARRAGARGGRIIAGGERYCDDGEFMDYEEDTNMDMTTLSPNNNNPNLLNDNNGGDLSGDAAAWWGEARGVSRMKRVINKVVKKRSSKVMKDVANPYLKKQRFEEVTISQLAQR